MWRIERARKLLSGVHFDAKGRKFSTQGKKRVKKQVKGKDGKSYMQTFWVKGEQEKPADKPRLAKGADFLGKELRNPRSDLPLVIVKDLGLGNIPSPRDRPKAKAFAYSSGTSNFAYFKSDEQHLPGIVTTDELEVMENDPFDETSPETFLSGFGDKVFFEPKTNTVWRAEDFPFTQYIDNNPGAWIKQKNSTVRGERIIDTALRLGVQHSGNYSSFSQLEANALGKEVARKGLTMALSDPGSKEYDAFVSYQKLRQSASKNKWVRKEQLEVLDAFFASGTFARGETPVPMSEKKARRELEFFYLEKGKSLPVAQALSSSVIEKSKKRGVPIE